MSYYNVIGLQREPFSTSPDPEFLYRSNSHYSALNRLEIAIRLRRGLSVILGDVGMGKTTLSRALLQTFKDEEDFIFHMILDPSYKSEYQFLQNLIKIFGITAEFNSTLDFKEELEKYLFQKGVNENKTIVLLIDEGQKMSPENLEVLRTLLNYETNEYKLLQLVIMAQIELLPRIKRINNFMDRIALKYTINPLDEEETREMINFRLTQAGFHNRDGLFSDKAVKLIYQHTQGYPRKIAMLCHDALESIVMNEQFEINEETIENLIKSRKEP
ncbi:MAG: AAA family ATPase [Candidatus Omnitrophica bacterium]|nr:AAA family ATPase [Candidatus Omnitrophota bacterium]